jgi:hypothetical protein
LNNLCARGAENESSLSVKPILISFQYFYNILKSAFNVLHENFVIFVTFLIRFFGFVFSGSVGGEIKAVPSNLSDAYFTCTLGAGKG